MKIKVNGDIVTVVSTIPFEDLKKVAPLFLVDDKGRKVYGLDVAQIGTLTESGVSFTYATADGSAAFNFAMPDSGPEAVEKLVADYSTEFAILSENEEALQEHVNKALLRRAKIADMIEVG